MRDLFVVDKSDAAGVSVASTLKDVDFDRDIRRLINGSIIGTDQATILINMLATTLDTTAIILTFERYDLTYAPTVNPIWDSNLVAVEDLNGTFSYS